MSGEDSRPSRIEVRGARVHNLRNVDVDIPLNRTVAIAGVSGSGKSSLALGVLYSEGSGRYLEALSAYTRRRMTQAARADVDDIRYVPAALALRQRPSPGGIRSTFGTSTELLNTVRLMFSRLGEHPCPNGHMQRPSAAFAAMRPVFCPECGGRVVPPSAEDLAFNSTGACPMCQGTGTAVEVDMDSLVPDQSLTIDEGAVKPWGTLMWSLMTDVCRAMGVRTDVPFRDLTDEEKHIVYDGPAVKKHILYKAKDGNNAGEMDFTYYSARYTVLNSLSKVKDEKGMKKLERFLRTGPCPECGGTRLSAKARSSRLMGLSLDRVCAMPLSELETWIGAIPAAVPPELKAVADALCGSFRGISRRLLDLGLGYLSMDRSAPTLSNGERQRVYLARSVRNRTTGTLYILDEPSIGLHPSNLKGLCGVIDDLVADGNSVVLVDHDTDVLEHADYMIEMGPGAGSAGGMVIAQGTVPEIIADPRSVIAPFLGHGGEHPALPPKDRGKLFSDGAIHLEISGIHTVKPLSADIPMGRMTVVTGVSGSGKTTLVLESLVPALEAMVSGRPLPPHVTCLRAEGIHSVKLIDATPIGVNVRSTVATYAGVHDDLRKAFAKTADAKAEGYSAGDFSYNTGKLRCPGCDGTGTVSLDIQFLPDIEVPCPDCGGSRYAPGAYGIKRACAGGGSVSLPELMEMDAERASGVCGDMPAVKRKLQTLIDLGLGYLTLGEDTPSLSGGEAQRLKLAGEMGRGQADAVFVFDEPTIGLHPSDVLVLLRVFSELVGKGATVIVIEHDLSVMRNADYIIDMGPGGGDEGGTVVVSGTPEEVRECPASITGKFI